MLISSRIENLSALLGVPLLVFMQEQAALCLSALLSRHPPSASQS